MTRGAAWEELGGPEEVALLTAPPPPGQPQASPAFDGVQGPVPAGPSPSQAQAHLLEAWASLRQGLNQQDRWQHDPTEAHH